MDDKKEQRELKDLPVQSVRTNGNEFTYVESGAGEPVVLVHGELGDYRTWLNQISRLRARYRAISYSRRFHWPINTARSGESYTRDLHAKDLTAFLKSLDLGPVHLVGHGFGASVALLAALEDPDLVESITLGEPGPFLGLFDVSELNLVSKQKLGFDEVILLAKRGSSEAAIRRFLEVIVGADVLDQFSEEARTVVTDNAHALVPILEHYYASPAISRAQWEALEAPTLLISGEFSPRIARLTSAKLHECLPNSRELILRSVSHGLHIENPSDFNLVLLKFLDSVSRMSVA